MAKKVITEEQLRAANKANFTPQQIAQEINKFEKRTGNDAVYSGTLPNGQTMNPGLAPQPTPQVAQPVQTQPISQTGTQGTDKYGPQGQLIDGKYENERRQDNEMRTGYQSGVVGGTVEERQAKQVGAPVISPALQAKIDAKKNGVPASPITSMPAGMTDAEIISAGGKVENGVQSLPIGTNTGDFWIKGPDGKLMENPNMSEETRMGKIWDNNRARGTADERGKKVMASFGAKWDSMSEEEKKQAYINYKEEKSSTGMPKYTAEGVKTGVEGEVSDLEKQAQATGVEYTMQNGQATYNPKTTEEAAKILAMGGKLAGETKMSAVAQASLNKVRGLGQMTDQQLANNIAGGQVSNKELELLNTMNPQLVAQAKELSKKKVITNTTNEIQADNSAIIKGEEPTGMSKPLTDLLTKLANIDADTKSPAEMKTAYQDSHPEMIQSRDAINDLTKQKRDAQLAKMNLWKDYRAKNGDLPMSMLMAGYSALSRDLDNQIYLLNDDLNTEISNYNMYLDDMNAEIEFEIGQQGKEEERLWNMYGVTRAEEIREEDLIRADQEFTAQMEQARSEAEYNQFKDERDYNFKIWETEYGIKKDERDYGLKLDELDYNRSKDERDFKFKVADAENAFNLKVEELNRSGQGKWKEDSLGNLYNDTTGERMTRQEILNESNNTVSTGNTMGTFKPPTNFQSRGAGMSVKVMNTGNGIEIGIPVGTNAGQCGKLANDYAENIPGYKWVGDSWADKLKNDNSDLPVAGGLFMYNPSGASNEKYGHIGIVESVNPDGSFVAYDTNAKGTGKTNRRTIKPGDKEYNKINKDGGFFAPPGTNPQAQVQAEPQRAYNDTDISIFNSITATEKKKLQNDPQYEQFITDYNSVMRNKDASIEDILRYSAGFKTIGDKEGERLQKFSTALTQIGDLQKDIRKNGTGPIIGIFRNANPYDTNAQTVKAELQSLIPGLARGVYGEVGVLTDQDIENYRKTIPNLKSTKDVNEAILAMTIKTLASGYKQALQDLAGAKNDVSGFQGTYYRLMEKANEIERRLGINTSLSQEDELEALSIR